MSQNFTIELNDTICSLCYCEDQKFLHHVWDGTKGQKICTSCVLFEHKCSFCPACFDLVEFNKSREDLTFCLECGSATHLRCISGIHEDFVCLTCRNPERLIFDFQKTGPKESQCCYKVMDMKSAKLLLTAFKVAEKLISKAHEELLDYAKLHAIGKILKKKKATDGVKLFMKSAESNVGPSLLDSSLETSHKNVN